MVRTAHGLLPVLAPATVLLVEGFETIDDGISGERVTPTRAAIMCYLCKTCNIARTVRCRLRKSGIVIELDTESLTALTPDARPTLIGMIATALPAYLAQQPIGFAACRNGGAFVGAGA